MRLASLMATGIVALLFPLTARPCSMAPALCSSGGAVAPTTMSAPWIPFVPGTEADDTRHTVSEHEVALVDEGGAPVPFTEHADPRTQKWLYLEPSRPLAEGEKLRLTWKSFCDQQQSPHEGEFMRELAFTVGPAAPVPDSFGSAILRAARTYREARLVGNPCDNRSVTEVGTELIIELQPAPELEPFLSTAQLGWRIGDGDWTWSMPGLLSYSPRAHEFKHRTQCTGRFVERFEFALHIPGSEQQPEPFALDVDVACAFSEAPPPDDPLPEPPDEAVGCGCSGAGGGVLGSLPLLFIGWTAARRRRALLSKSR